MFINHEKKIIFLSNPKTGSQSIQWLLQNKLKFKHILDIKKVCNTHYSHSNMDSIIKYLNIKGYDPKEYTYIIFVRNPIKRLISNFFYCKFDEDWHSFYSVESHNALKDYSVPYKHTYNGLCETYDINDYIDRGMELSSMLCTHPEPVDKMIKLDNDYDVKVFKLENMSDFVSYMKSRFPNSNIIIKKYNETKSKKKPVDSDISPENLNKIKNIFKYDIENYYPDLL